MSSQEQAESGIQVSVRDIGGISETSVELRPGVNVLTGRNATNRTSFLRALMAALGSDDIALKGDADEGWVELTVDGDTYTRTVTRRDGTTVFDGDPLLEKCEVADLFAFQLEANEARRAIERGDDLYDVIMRPVDTDEIDAEVDRLEAERAEIESQLEALDDLERRLPELEERRAELDADIDEKQAVLAEKQAALDDLEGHQEPASELEERLEDLREARTELEEVRRDIDAEERIIDALHEDRADIEADLEGLAEAGADEADELDSEIRRLRGELETVESTLGNLQSVIQFNETVLDEPHHEGIRELAGDVHDDEGPVTDQLLADGEEVVCWTCGSRVEREEVETTVGLLRDTHREKIERRNALQEEIEELEAERKHIERTRDRRRELQRQLDEVETDLTERTDRLEKLERDADDLEATVEELKAVVDDIETDGTDNQFERLREVHELEFEVDRLEADLDEVTTEIESIEERLEERAGLEADLNGIDGEIDDLRSRIRRLEAAAVEQFNEQMDAIIELLEFENVERVWIERVETEVKEGRRTVSSPAFDLHVVRTTESGSAYEDTVDHLSESEREVVGLVFALSGYLVHEVYEDVPFMLLDSLEALDAERIADLVDYFSQYAYTLVVALLPEDAAAVDEGYHRLAEI